MEHPRSRPREPRSPPWQQHEQGVRKSHTEPECGKHAECQLPRLGDRIPQRSPHERRGARTCRHHRQNARRGGIDRGSLVPPGRECRGQQPSKLEDAHQVEPDGKEQHRQHEDDSGLLQLETPTDGAARCTQGEQRARQCEERQHHARGVSRCVQAQCLRRRVSGRRVARQAEQLDRQNREDAGHQIQQHPAHECEQQRTQPGGRCAVHQGNRCGAVRGLRAVTERRSASRHREGGNGAHRAVELHRTSVATPHGRIAGQGASRRGQLGDRDARKRRRRAHAVQQTKAHGVTAVRSEELVASGIDELLGIREDMHHRWRT